MKEITPSLLKQRMDAGDTPALLDVREPWEYDICHIAGSISLPMNQIPGRYGELDPQRGVVVICHHGMRSAQVAAYLTGQGMENVMNLAGGVDAWAREVDGRMPVY